MYEYVTSMKAIHRKGYILGANESVFGDYNYFLKDLKQYQKVTQENIKETAAQFLTQQGISTVELMPLH